MSSQQEREGVITQVAEVLREWVDQNGHMNVGYHAIAFGRGVDCFLERYLAFGPAVIEEAAGPGIGNTGTQCHMWASGCEYRAHIIAIECSVVVEMCLL